MLGFNKILRLSKQTSPTNFVGLKGSGNLPTRYARFGKPNWWIFLMKFNWLDFCSFFWQCWMRFYYGFLVIFLGGWIWGCFWLAFFGELSLQSSLDFWFLWKADAKDQEKRKHGFYMILLCSNRCKDTWTQFYLIFMTLYNWICSMFGDEAYQMPLLVGVVFFSSSLIDEADVKMKCDFGCGQVIPTCNMNWWPMTCSILIV